MSKLDTLYHKLKLPMHLIIVFINETTSKELISFDTDDADNLIPYNGTYTKFAER